MNSPVEAISSSWFDIRQASINLNQWYVVARASEVGDRPLGVVLWQQEIVLYRDTKGQIHALADRCPHRYVKLSRGVVIGDELECAYHGWRIGIEGHCTCVPYLEKNQKLPTGQVRRYPVRELDGFIWVYPGDISGSEENLPQPMGVPEWDDLNYIGSVTTIDTQAHFSYWIENLMDMYHGHLHQDLQAWASAELHSIEETSDRVDAHYTAQSYYQIDKIWSISQLFFPALRRLHPEPLDVSYVYPNWVSSLGDDFKIYCLFCPVSLTHTRAYLVHFTSLNAFHRLHKLPVAFRRFVKNSLFNTAEKLLQGLVAQDSPMIEDEQKAYLETPDRRPHELNRALISVQRLIRVQAELTPSRH